ncbi:GTPase IMAP family member 7-like [Notolabrus celidotus]|uniref:GTPase IMAP family member 7-like n=1 Tax=Notolabrus celidotus TaxID=1203425 RepID=UPI001490691E|nr:GTPase IMAP family member 7-like [Notolabrus celidotus]
MALGGDCEKCILSESRRIVILGKTGAGKSSLANTISGQRLFKVNHTPKSGTSECQAETIYVKGRRLTLIDTPGFFDTITPEESLKPEIVRCITECAPGPHAFLILLKVEKFSEHERAVIDKIKGYLSEEAFRYATVVFTHGDQLQEGHTIEDFIHEDENLRDLVQKCGGRCAVIDNKYWDKKDEDRSNEVQVEKLLKVTDKMIKDNKNGCYTNETLLAVEEKIQQEIKIIKQDQQSGSVMSVQKIETKAKRSVWKKLLTKLIGITVGALLGAFFGAAIMVGVAFRRNSQAPSVITLAASAAVGAVIGGGVGYVAASGAETPKEAAKKAAKAVKAVYEESVLA